MNMPTSPERVSNEFDPSSRRSKPLRPLMAMVLLGSLFAGVSAAPGRMAPEHSPSALESAARHFLKARTSGMEGLVSIQVSPPLRALPRCEALEAFAPVGSPAIGKTSVGLQCHSPQRWTAYLPTEIRVISAYVVTRQALPPGHVIAESDLEARQGDLGTLPADMVTRAQQVVGYRTLSGLAAQAPVRSGLLRQPMAVQQGQSTRLTISGPGFSIATEGLALASAGREERVRVRTTSGHVVSGVAQSSQNVTVNF